MHGNERGKRQLGQWAAGEDECTAGSRGKRGEMPDFT